MTKNTPVQIEAAANGFIVTPAVRDTNCTFSSSSMFVFNQFDDMMKWLSEHFAKDTNGN